MITLGTSLQKIPNIGTLLIKKLNSLNIQTIGDLLYYFPFRYEDFSQVKTIENVRVGQTVTIKGQILKINTSRTWKKKMNLTEAWVTDGQAMIKAVWFNAPLPVRYLSKGKYVQLSGKIAAGKKQEPYFQHPNVETISALAAAEEDTPAFSRIASTGILAPVYSETRGINSYLLRRLIRTYLGRSQILDFIPKDILQSQQLLELKTALEQIHFPQTLEQAKEAKRRFAFEKMFLVQIKALQVKKNWESHQAVAIPFAEKFIQQFVGKLPFELTNAQKKSAWQIIKDLEKSQPMNRLLEGDVGSGKTVVAAMSAVSVLQQKYQAAILAPTEVLAIQHYLGISKLLKDYNFSVGLLTGSKVELSSNEIDAVNQKTESESNKKNKPKNLTKKLFLEKLKKGEINLVIGTHALLQEKIKFKNLALVIIDEQHRFGVKQRAYLQQGTLNLDDGKKNTIPHLLSMTATPIPRTLSLAIFGNLELSIIDEFPKGRKPIKTQVIAPDKRQLIYEFVKKEILAGRQVFVICPLVEETSKMTEVKAATEEKARLEKEIFQNFSVGLLHGKMKPKEKELVMQEFKDKKYDILVSTSVVEVGVDVPNATIMLIEGAERFGLSQLHQFRGRVGRGEHQSYCFLFTSNNMPETTNRLRAMEKTTNGFKIAEYDLQLRGPGQFLGTMQSGVPDIAMESLSDVKLIQSSRLEAQRILAFDPKLENFPLLKEQVEKLDALVHWE